MVFVLRDRAIIVCLPRLAAGAPLPQSARIVMVRAEQAALARRRRFVHCKQVVIIVVNNVLRLSESANRTFFTPTMSIDVTAAVCIITVAATAARRRSRKWVPHARRRHCQWHGA